MRSNGKSSEKHFVTIDGVSVEVVFNERALLDCDLTSTSTAVMAANLDAAAEILDRPPGRFAAAILDMRVYGRTRVYEDIVTVFIDRILEAQNLSTEHAQVA